MRDGLGGERWMRVVTDRGVTTKPKQTENEELNAKNQTVVHDSKTPIESIHSVVSN